MRKTVTLLLAIIFTAIHANAQAPANATVYDCNSNSKNIYTTLATGKSVIVLHKGVDCSICRGAAAGWQTWAAANTTNVEVWGALTYTYSGFAFPLSNSCNLTSNWVSTYGWNDIFTFPDSNRLWVQAASPRYYVYSAIDSSIVYQGPNSTIARNTAISQSAVGLQSNILASAKIYSSDGTVYVKDLPESIETLRVYNLTGQIVFEKRTNQANFTLDVSEYQKGIYFVQFISPAGTEAKSLYF